MLFSFFRSDKDNHKIRQKTKRYAKFLWFYIHFQRSIGVAKVRIYT